MELQTLCLASHRQASMKKKTPSRKHSNSLSSAILPYVGQPFRPQPQLRTRPLTTPPSPHLRHSRAPPASPILGHVSSRVSRQKVPTRPAVVACVRGYQSYKVAITTTLYLGFDKTRELIARKCSWPSLQKDIETNVKGYDACLDSQARRHKPYGDPQSLPAPTHRYKDLPMNFVTGLPISAVGKNDSYDSILIIVDRLTKMVHYEPAKIDAPGLAVAILDVVVRHHGLPDLIISDKGSLLPPSSGHRFDISSESCADSLPPPSSD